MFSRPQQLSPPGQSQEYRQWNADWPALQFVVVPATHVPVGVGRAGVTQQVLVRRSHVVAPEQTGAV